MFILDLLGWWYSRGWSWAGKHLFIIRSERIVRFFSIPELLKTLFAPFRQDVTNLQGGSIGLKLQALGNNIVSRSFGLLLRTAIIFTGLVALIANMAFAVITYVIWPLIPLAPVVVLILLLAGIGHAKS